MKRLRIRQIFLKMQALLILLENGETECAKEEAKKILEILDQR